MPALYIGLDNPLQAETQALHASLWLKQRERTKTTTPTNSFNHLTQEK